MTERSASTIGKRCIRLAGSACVIAVIALAAANPVLAAGFGDAAQSVITPTCAAFSAARKVLITAAVLAVIVGLAPMLWGQVKVKWVVSSLVVCVLFSVIPTMVSAFAGGVTGCGS